MRSHGDGRRMTLTEAIYRRRRLIEIWGSIDEATTFATAPHAGDDAEPHRHDRRWAQSSCWGPTCRGEGQGAVLADDVVLVDGAPESRCFRCRISS